VKLLEDAAKMGAEFHSDSSITSRITFIMRALQHQRWMTGDYGRGQDVKHSYLACMAHVSVA
jgi:hypothetical protein